MRKKPGQTPKGGYFIDTKTGKITYSDDNQESSDIRDQKGDVFLFGGGYFPIDMVTHRISDILGNDNLGFPLIEQENPGQSAIDEIVEENIGEIFGKNPEFDKIMFELERSK